jgi:uncharacterized protein with ParB-like and HNH nuclease domain
MKAYLNGMLPNEEVVAELLKMAKYAGSPCGRRLNMDSDERLLNKIDADDETVAELLSNKKFIIDYFQREYRWTEKQMVQLTEDLTDTFLKSYNKGDNRGAVENYQSYYLGPVVFFVGSKGKKSIIDGQQRITSLTLLLIYLRHLQKGAPEEMRESVDDMIFSKMYGTKSFNIADEDREPCMNGLYENGAYEIKERDNESVQNLVGRYDDIQRAFPGEDIDQEALPYFIDWLKNKVILVKIDAYSEDNAYVIFETMNDRGLNLTPTEMLKGYVLTQIKVKRERDEINELWKKNMQALHEFDKDTDLAFFQAWFRGKYAETIRQGKAGSENMDFELVGSKFHIWFKDHFEDGMFCAPTSEGIYSLFKNEFPFFVNVFTKTLKAKTTISANTPHLHYIHFWGIAYSLQQPMLLSPIEISDDEATIDKKLDRIARFIETYSVRRGVNYRRFGQSTIKYSMFNIIKLVRNNGLEELCGNLEKETTGIAESFSAIDSLGLTGNNKTFIKHLLARISSFTDSLVGKGTTYDTYYRPSGKQFEIEHLWADKWKAYHPEIEQESEFKTWRNRIGALILLPHGTNQSFGSDKYEDKLPYYYGENTYAQTLYAQFYEKNPNFLKNTEAQSLGFRAFPHMRKEDIVERCELVQRICEHIWPDEYLD